jgi:hypothetical protein
MKIRWKSIPYSTELVVGGGRNKLPKISENLSETSCFVAVSGDISVDSRLRRGGADRGKCGGSFGTGLARNGGRSREKSSSEVGSSRRGEEENLGFKTEFRRNYDYATELPLIVTSSLQLRFGPTIYVRTRIDEPDITVWLALPISSPNLKITFLPLLNIK